jgi:uncharacterized membrane protein (DUF485 family)
MATKKAPDGSSSLSAIAESPKYKELIARRGRLGWVLTIIMLIVYYGYIATIAFDKSILAQPIGSGKMSLGIPVGFGLIVFTILITGYYVVRANNDFDRLVDEIKKEAGQ